MKRSHRVLALLLSLLVLAGCVSPIGLAASGTGLTKITGLKITTADKANYLKLTWTKQPAARGYQVYRSTSGKTGSYSRVAVVSKAAFADKELKSSTAYYYKVRAYAKQNGKTVYGAFAKADLSTRVTKSFAQKRSRQVYLTANNWLHQYWFEWDENRKNEVPLVVRYTGDPALAWIYGEKAHFYRLNHPTIKTMQQLKKHLMKTFSKGTVDTITKHYYKEKNGVLYRIASISGDEAPVLFPSKNKIRFSKITDKRIDMILYVTSMQYDYDKEIDVTSVHAQKESLYYQNGRWVFGKNVNGQFWQYGMWFLNGDTMVPDGSARTKSSLKEA